VADSAAVVPESLDARASRTNDNGAGPNTGPSGRRARSDRS
jgi:hypothetical protein